MPQPDTEQLLTFTIGRDEYGISILRVREIAEYRTLTPVPMRPAWMRGVVNLRGSVVPVVDLAAKLGLAYTSFSRRTCLIIVDVDTDGDRSVVAVMVDAVRRVVQVAQEDIQEPPAFGMPADVVPGMVHVDGALITLLDLHAIVADDASVERWASAHRGAGEELSEEPRRAEAPPLHRIAEENADARL